jgi:hypothetical protein
MQVLEALVSYSEIFLIISGLILVLDFIEWKAKKEENWKPYVTLLVVIGFFFGILDFVIVASGWSTGAFDTATIILFILAGLTLTLAPTVKLPLAGLVSLLIGGIAAFFISGFIHNTWIIAIAFIVIVAIIFLFAKAVESVLDIIGKVLGFPLISIPLGLVCMLQGALLLFGLTLSIFF